MLLTRVQSEPKTLVDTILDGLKSTKQVNQNGRMYASSSGFCERQTALSMTYSGEQTTEPQTTLYFGLGLSIESMILDALDNQGVLLFRQFETPDIGLNMGGKIDGIYRLPDDKIRLLEIKSCGKLPKEPFREHLAQSNLYSAITGLPIDILYVSRNVLDFNGKIQIKSFLEVNNSFDCYTAMYKAIYGKKCADLGYMPEKSIHINSIDDCGFCRFKGICWNYEPSHLAQPDNEKYWNISQLAQDETFVIMSEDEITKRKHGVLKHLSIYGNEYARELLNGTDWTNLV